jgi:nucleotide-binding universal stress UspA family protein
MFPFRHVLVATDFGDSSRRAIEVATGLVEGSDARLTVVHVCELPNLVYGDFGFTLVDVVGPLEEAAKARLVEQMSDVRAKVPTAKSQLRTGIAWEGILDAAKADGADLIVVGTHGRHGVRHVLLGSVAEKVVRLSKVPVLTVRGLP